MPSFGTDVRCRDYRGSRILGPVRSAFDPERALIAITLSGRILLARHVLQPVLAPASRSAIGGVVFCFGQFGDVERGVAESDQPLTARQCDQIEKSLIPRQADYDRNSAK